MLGINIEFSSFFIILCLLIGLGCSTLLYYSEDTINKTLRRILFISRTLFISLILFLLLKPFVKSLDNIYEKPIIIIAQDVSSSLEEHKIKDKLDTLVNRLEKNNFEVVSFNFSDKIQNGLTDKYLGVATNYSGLIDNLNSRFINQNVSGVILASDGLYNMGSNPLYKKLNFPYYTLALGDTIIYKDVLIHKVVNNDFVFLGNIFQIEFMIKSNKCMGENVKIQIFHNNKLIAQQELYIDQQEKLNKIHFDIESSHVGVQKYTCKISSLKGEKNYKNNIIDTYIEVIDETNNILILVGNSHPDINAYKVAIEKNLDYRTDVYFIDDFNKELKEYQLIVLSGIEDNSIIERVLDSGISTLVFSRGDLLMYKDLFPSIDLYSQGKKKETFLAKNPVFSKFTFSQNLKTLLANSPPLHIASSKLNIINSENVVLYEKQGAYTTTQPIILVDELVNQKNGLILAEGFWKMKQYDYRINQSNLAFDEFFNKITQLLIFNQDRSKFRISFSNKVLENHDVYFEAEIYDEIYELVNHQDIDLEIFSKNKEKRSFLFLKDINKYFLNLGVLEPGDYYFKAKIRGTDLVKEGSFTIQSIHLEGMNLTADHQILYQLSKMLDGDLFFPDQMNSLIDILNTNKNTIIHVKEKTHGLINIHWILLILLSLIAFEWFIRKYNGLI